MRQMSKQANRFDPNAKWLRAQMNDINKYSYIVIERPERQREVEAELKERHIKYTVTGTKTKTYHLVDANV